MATLSGPEGSLERSRPERQRRATMARSTTTKHAGDFFGHFTVYFIVLTKNNCTQKLSFVRSTPRPSSKSDSEAASENAQAGFKGFLPYWIRSTYPQRLHLCKNTWSLKISCSYCFPSSFGQKAECVLSVQHLPFTIVMTCGLISSIMKEDPVPGLNCGDWSWD